MALIDDLLDQTDSAKNEIVELEQALVRIPSVNSGLMPTGNETPVCELAKDWLAEDGIESEILERVPGRGNLIARLEGSSDEAGLMFMSHTDVVPVEDESKWKFPPFAATISGGRIYGRGSSDCKALLTAQLMAMRILRRNGVRLRKSLVLASGADEEHGGRYGFGWLAEHHPEKIKAPYAVNEGGGTPMAAAGGLAYILGVGEKGRLQAEFTVRGTSAHASVPWQGTNATYRLAELIRRIGAYEPDLDTSLEMFQHLSTFAIEHKPSPDNIEDILVEVEPDNPDLGSVLRALSRMTVTPTMVQGGVKSNSVPESIGLTCDIRSLPHQDETYIREQLAGIMEGVQNTELNLDFMAVANSSPFETGFVDRIKNAMSMALGRDDIRWVPGVSTGFTDSRFTRQLGTDTYGFSGRHPDDDPLEEKVHGTDESIGIRSLVSGTRAMVSLAYDMLAER